jgi:hypothetical protein
MLAMKRRLSTPSPDIVVVALTAEAAARALSGLNERQTKAPELAFQLWGFSLPWNRSSTATEISDILSHLITITGKHDDRSNLAG